MGCDEDETAWLNFLLQVEQQASLVIRYLLTKHLSTQRVINLFSSAAYRKNSAVVYSSLACIH